MDNGLLTHIVCVFMRATYCHLIIVCFIMLCYTAVCTEVCAVVSVVFSNTFFVSQCGVCVNNFNHALLPTTD